MDANVKKQLLKDPEQPENPRPKAFKERTNYNYNHNYYYTSAAAKDESHVDSCTWFMFFVVILFFLGIFLIVWFVPYHSTASARFPDGVNAETGSSGEMIPGLGNVASASNLVTHTMTAADCGAWENYNASSQMCQPKTFIPVGVDSSLFDRNINQCESFYNHTCGSWLKYNEARLQAGRRVDRTFGYLQRLNKYTLNQIIEQSEPTSAIFQFYRSCVDALVHQRQAEQTKKYQQYLMQTIRSSFNRIEDLAIVFAKLIEIGFTAPIGIGIEEHPMKAQMIPFFANDGFFGITTQEVTNLFSSFYSDPEIVRKKTEDFMLLNENIENHRPDDDKAIGKSLKTFVAYLEGPDFNLDTMFFEDVLRLMRPTFDVDTFLSRLHLTTFPSYHPAWIRTKSYYRWLFGSFGPVKASSLNQWQAYVELSILYGTSNYFPELPQTVFLRSSKDQGVPNRHIGGHERSRSMRKRDGSIRVTHEDCKMATEMFLPGFVSKKYITYTNPVVRERVTDMAQKIRKQLKKAVDYAGASWMTVHDSRHAQKKLDAMIIRVAEPHMWNEEPFGAQLQMTNYLHNMELIRRYRVQRQWERWDPNLGKPNRDEIQQFQAPLSTVNAMYSPITNTITIYAGILQYPFVHERYDNATMYATIGTVIGHEMAHGFGPYGRRFDSEGLFRAGRMGWWERATVTKYDEQIQCIINEYGSPATVALLRQKCPNLPDTNAYGQMVITEEVADVMGVRAAYDAYWTTQKELESVDAKKNWFYSFAQMWCSVASAEYECKHMQGDPHAVPRVRVDNTLRLLEQFDQVFNCPKGTFMRNDNDEKCRIF